MSVLIVSSTVNIKAVTSRVSEVFLGTLEVVESLSSIIWLNLSDNNSSVVSEHLLDLVRDSKASLVGSSYSSGSLVIDEPLVVVWSELASDSNSELLLSNMLSDSECSSTSHSGSDLELNTFLNWEFG